MQSQTLLKLDLGKERCPVVMQKIVLSVKDFKSDDNAKHLLIITCEPTAKRDITGFLKKTGGVNLQQHEVIDEKQIFLLTKMD